MHVVTASRMLGQLSLVNPHLAYRHDLVWTRSKWCYVLFDPLRRSSVRLFCLLLRLKDADGQSHVLPHLHHVILDKS